MSVLLASFAFAEFDLGIKLGANYSYINPEGLDFQDHVDNFKELDNITGFVGGAFAVVGSDLLALQLEGLFSMEGFSIDQIIAGDGASDVIENTTIRTNYLNAVALARLNLPIALINPFIAVGVNVGIPLGDPEIDEGVEAPAIDLDNFDFKNLGLCFAGGFKVLDMVDVELRYVHGLTDIYSLETEDTESAFSRLIRLSLGLYIF